MDDLSVSGKWLLIDAAGPRNVVGLVEDGNWLCKVVDDGDFLAMLQPASARLLSETDLALEILSGAIYATGPGSTLGLRLAAMFIRSLMEMPMLGHWRCLQYQNLEFAVRESGESEAVAPWRRDRFHHISFNSSPHSGYRHGQISPIEAEQRKLPGFELGRRPPSFENKIIWQPQPIDTLPALLNYHPDLLEDVESPLPYSAEKPEFARWNPKRHMKP